VKRFKSFLDEYIEDFIEYRLQLGYSDKMLLCGLRVLDRYVADINATWASFDPLFFIRLRSDLKYENRSINTFFRTFKMFFKYLIRRDMIRENPIQEIAELPENQIIPFIFSPEETDLLLETVIKLIRKTERYYLADFSGYISFLLMARCGLRISETFNLLKSNYRPDERTIYIEKTKFKKDRLIPIPKSVSCEINNLLKVRRLFLSADDHTLLLIKGNGKGLVRHYMDRKFNKVISIINLDQPRKIIGATNFSNPTRHSLRHSFAVNTLKRIKQQGKSPQNALPVLAAYMGHSEYKYTTKYLRVLDAEHRRQMLDFSMLKSGDI
jgi:site-specific recombinase XerD